MSDDKNEPCNDEGGIVQGIQLTSMLIRLRA